MKSLRTIIIVGLALVLGLTGMAGGDTRVSASEVTATDLESTHVLGFAYDGYGPYEGQFLNQSLQDGYDLTDETTFGNLFDKYADGGMRLDRLWQTMSFVTNNVWTPVQANRYLGVPEDTDLSMFSERTVGQAFSAEKFNELAIEKPEISGTLYCEIPHEKLPYIPATVTLSLTYKMADGSVVPEKAFSDYQNPRVITGYPGEVYTDTNHFLIPQIAGYTANTDKVEFIQDQTVESQMDKVQVDETQTGETQVEPVTITYTKNPVVQPEVKVPTLLKVYGRQNLYTYKSVNFKKSERIHHYLKKPRTYAPVFDVVDRAESRHGNPRYKLRDGSYITAKKAYVDNLYWQGDQQQLYVTSPRGTNLYQGLPLKDKVRHLKQGTSVQVVKMIKKGYLTRYQLADGTYITGNKQLVSPTKPKVVAKVKTKANINLYRDVNLQRRIKRIAKGQTVAVKGWDYAFGGITGMISHKRYKMAGGYITANTKLIQIMK